jgi:hypothetical protein
MSESGFEERRSSARLDMEKQMVSIKWTDANKQSQKRLVTCMDVSRGGLKLELEVAIPVDSLVEVQLTPENLSPQTFQAKVIRCAQLEHGWFNIGLKFS